jgi:hypothetical protein
MDPSGLLRNRPAEASQQSLPLSHGAPTINTYPCASTSFYV